MEAFVVGFHGALDVTEIVLEGADLDGELVAKIVERQLLLPEPLNDLLPTGSGHNPASIGGSAVKPVSTTRKNGTPETGL